MFSSNVCCKPFPNSKCSNKLRSVTEACRIKLQNYNDKSNKICTSCYIKLNLKKDDNSNSTSNNTEEFQIEQEVQLEQINQNINKVQSAPSTDSSESEPEQSTSIMLPSVTPNLLDIQRFQLIQNINIHIIPHLIEEVSPIKKRLCTRSSYAHRKSEQVIRSMKQTLLDDSSPEITADTEKKALYYDEILENLKHQYQNGDYLEQRRILSVLPSSMSQQEIKDIFGEKTTEHAIKRSKECQRNLKLFSAITPPNYARHTLSDAITSRVIEFYTDDEISRPMPGIQDVVVVRDQDSNKQHVQKRLLLSTIREAYLEYKKRYPIEKVGFGKFSLLRPRQCIVLGDGNQQNVCVCTLHQNMKLMLEKSDLKLMRIDGSAFNTYKDIISFVMCGNDQCHVSMCATCCATLEKLQSEIVKFFRNSGIISVKYKNWNTTDRCDLSTFIDGIEEFTTKFIGHLKLLIPHHFISQQQSNFLRTKKEALQSGEFLIQMDFAENYSFIIQDAVQGYHWTNSQATVHPFVIYYKDSDNILVHTSFIIISDCNTHDSIAVAVFIQKLIAFLRRNVTNRISKIIFMSDGAGSQYKNKYGFINLSHFELDYGIKAEWHFHATSHGKGPCDGIGGTLKRAAQRYSIANKSTIQTAEDLFNWATTQWNSEIKIDFSSTEEYETMKENLKSRYSIAVTITGTQKFHSFVPVNERDIQVRTYSNCQEFQVRKIFRK